MATPSDTKYEEFIEASADEAGRLRKSRSSSSIPLTYLIAAGAVLFILLIATAIAIIVSITVSVGDSPKQQSNEGSLHTINVTQEELEGEYYGTNGAGIYFHVTVTDTHLTLRITNTDGGHVVVNVMHPIASNMTMMSVNDTNFMIMENQPGRPKYDDYIVPGSLLNETISMMMEDKEMNDYILRKFDNQTVNETRQSVLHNLAMSEEAILIIEAAQELGDSGVLGTEYPPAMRFYQFALQLANAVKGNTRASDENGIQNKQGRKKREQAHYCTSNGAYCENCPVGSDCFGLCGKGCFCWFFVCGDCCLHEYCRSHDDCCVIRGFWSWPCLSVTWRVLGSQCEDTYSC